MKTNYEYRAAARETLNGHWNEVVLMSVILFGLAILFCAPQALSGLESLAGIFGSAYFVALILLIGPLEYAFFNVLLLMIRERLDAQTHVGAMWRVFKTDFSRSVPAILLSSIIIVLISIPTLFIGGIILSYSYKMVPLLLHDYPELSTREVLRTSREMMRGHKWDLFLLELSFLGWVLLSILTLGIGLLWLTPYIYAAEAHFYEDLKAETIVEE